MNDEEIVIDSWEAPVPDYRECVDVRLIELPDGTLEVQFADDEAEGDESEDAWIIDGDVNQVWLQRMRSTRIALNARTQQMRRIGRFLRPERVEEFIRALPWSEDTPDLHKTLVAGNLRNFAAAIRAASKGENA